MSRLFGADRVEQPVTLDTPVPTEVGIALSASATFQSFTDPVADQGFSDHLRFGILIAYPRTLRGPVTLRAALAHGLAAYDRTTQMSEIIGESINGSPASVAICVELLSQSDVAVSRHHGVCGGVEGSQTHPRVLAGV
jgi:hypothetical protein